jgi:cyanophycin synthetase
MLVGFLESRAPSITGDGRSTILKLIDEKNQHRSLDVAHIELTPMHLAYIARRGYVPEDILPEGVVLPLTYSAGAGSGGSGQEYGDQIHPQLKAEIERAAHITGLPLVGFDLILEDPHKSPQEQRWGIIEANSLPWINLHHTPHQGKPVNVAARVWDLWEAS